MIAIRFAAAALTAALMLSSGAPAGAVTVPASSSAGCPAAASCGLYSLGKQRWASSGGTVTIPYRVNWLGPGMAPDQVIDAIVAAAGAWEAANPRLRFKLEGIFYDLSQLGNTRNEISFVPTLPVNVTAQANHRAKGSTRLESDTLLNLSKPWSWAPCAQTNGSCKDAESAGVRLLDLQAVMTQQFGNWLGLATISNPAARDLTMYGAIAAGERRKSTLGKGDILGARAAYPCSCRPPRVFTP